MLKGMPDYYDMSMLLHGLGATRESKDVLFLKGDKKNERLYLSDFLLSFFLKKAFEKQLEASVKYEIGYVAYLAWMREQANLSKKTEKLSEALESLSDIISKKLLQRFTTGGVISEKTATQFKSVNTFKAINSKLYSWVFEHVKEKEQSEPVLISGLGSLGSKCSVSKFIVQMCESEVAKENNQVNDALKNFLLESPQAIINNTCRVVVQEMGRKLLVSDKSLSTLLKENFDVFNEPNPIIVEEKADKEEISRELLLFIYYLTSLIFYILVVDMRIENTSGKTYEDFLAGEGSEDTSEGVQGQGSSKDASNALDGKEFKASIYNVMARSLLVFGLASILIGVSQKKP